MFSAVQREREPGKEQGREKGVSCGGTDSSFKQSDSPLNLYYTFTYTLNLYTLLHYSPAGVYKGICEHWGTMEGFYTREYHDQICVLERINA